MINNFKLNYATLLLFVLLAATLSSVSSDFSKDKAECQEQLINLSSCLNYVTGEVKAPSSQCCATLYKTLNATKKCLCILVKDRNEPGLGVKLNATRALWLPNMCHTVNDPLECLGLLHLNPKSPEAQIFIQSANTTHADDVDDAPTTGQTNDGVPKMWRKMSINEALFAFWALLVMNM